jgi:hypothetical protein
LPQLAMAGRCSGCRPGGGRPSLTAIPRCMDPCRRIVRGIAPSRPWYLHALAVLGTTRAWTGMVVAVPAGVVLGAANVLVIHLSQAHPEPEGNVLRGLLDAFRAGVTEELGMRLCLLAFCVFIVGHRPCSRPEQFMTYLVLIIPHASAHSVTSSMTDHRGAHRRGRECPSVSGLMTSRKSPPASRTSVNPRWHSPRAGSGWPGRRGRGRRAVRGAGGLWLFWRGSVCPAARRPTRPRSLRAVGPALAGARRGGPRRRTPAQARADVIRAPKGSSRPRTTSPAALTRPEPRCYNRNRDQHQ